MSLQHARRGRLQETPRFQEQLFRRMVECVLDYAIFMLNPDGYITSWNAGAQRIKGYSADEIIGRHFSTFYPAEDIERDKPRDELEAAQALGRFEDEGWRVRKDGSVFWANVIITPMRDESGQLLGYAKVTRDLTERREAERSLVRAKAAAEAANRAKSEFLANVSHELRTPLNSMLILARLLADNADRALPPKQANYAEVIYSSGVDLLQLINEILDLARIESGAVIRLNPGTVSIGATSRYLEHTFRPMAQDKGLSFTVSADERAPAAIQSDPQRLQQVLKNLVANALKFTKQGGVSVRIARAVSGWTRGHEPLDRAESVIAFEVKDTGIGIPAHKRDVIFEPFEQGDGATSRQFGGTGLGLSISSKLARLLGGEICVSSAVGAGSTFTLFLPVAPQSPAAVLLV